MFSTHFVELTIYLIIVSLLNLTQHGVTSENPTVERLAKVIEGGLANAFSYEMPTNAKAHEPIDDEIRKFGSYDFVIIGGGTTGAVVARRLSENPKFSVLLLEASKWANDSFLQFFTAGFPAIHSEYSWGFTSVPQTTACLGLVNQICPAPQGKGLGGSPLINGAVYNHADPAAIKKR